MMGNDSNLIETMIDLLESTLPLSVTIQTIENLMTVVISQLFL
jgi:hypothetical protein